MTELLVAARHLLVASHRSSTEFVFRKGATGTSRNLGQADGHGALGCRESHLVACNVVGDICNGVAQSNCYYIASKRCARCGQVKRVLGCLREYSEATQGKSSMVNSHVFTVPPIQPGHFRAIWIVCRKHTYHQLTARHWSSLEHSTRTPHRTQYQECWSRMHLHCGGQQPHYH